MSPLHYEPAMDRKVGTALAIVRFSLGIFFLIWGLDKIFHPESTVKIFSHFYLLDIDVSTARAIGIVEGLWALALTAGLWKTWTYGLAVVLHGISTLSTWEQLLYPFGKNHLFAAAIPVLGACVLLFMLRDRDTRWSLRNRPG